MDIAVETAPSPQTIEAREWPMLLLIFVLLVARIAYGAIRELVPDEAYYWMWSRHLAPGYLDHPPMVALLIRMGTTIAGQSELGVRWPGAVLALATAFVMWKLACRLLEPRAAQWVLWILLLGPMLNVLGTIITPDTPLLFFASCALACAIFAIERDPRWWIGFGLSLGLGLVSKYTMIVPGVAVAIALLTSTRGRQEFRRPWVWIAVIIALVVFSPVIWWNANNHWASFEFQLHHGTTARNNQASDLAHLADLMSFLGGQLAVYTPVLLVLGFVAMADSWRRVRFLNLTDRILLLTASAPLALFAFFSLRRRPEPNWPLVAYLPLTIMIVKYVFQKAADAPSKRPTAWLRVGLITAVCSTVALHLPEAIWLVLPNIRQRTFESQFGWRDLAKAVRAVDPSAPVFCDTYENAAELSFYLPGQPQVWALSIDRPTVLDYLPGRPDPASLDKLLFVSSGTRTDLSAPIPGLEAFTHQAITACEPRVLRHPIRQRVIILAQR